MLLKDTCETAARIMNGELDTDLDYIAQACAARMKSRFRKGMKIRLVGTKNVDLEGAVGVIVKVNTKTISVGIGDATTDAWGTTYSKGEYNVSPKLVEAVAA